MICSVSGTLRDLTGAVLASTKVVFYRKGVAAQDNSTIVPKQVEATTDGSGVLTVSLYSGQYEAETIGFSGTKERFNVGVPDAASADLADLIDQYPAITPTILLDAVAARDGAIAAEAGAVAAAGTAASNAASLVEADLEAKRLQTAAHEDGANTAMNVAQTAAASAASVVSQDLSAITAVIPSGFKVGSKINPYEFGGDTSWMSGLGMSWGLGSKGVAAEERIATAYLGVAVNEAAARAVFGAADLDWYWNSTDGKCYQLNVTSGQTEKTRFGAAAFPTHGWVVFKSDRVIVLDEYARPWMVFGAGMFGVELSGVTFVGSILITGSSATYGRLALVDFALESARAYRGIASSNNTQGYWQGNLSDRNGSPLFDNTRLAIANDTVYAIAATVLPNAPFKNGRPVPTIAAFTDGGVSVIDGPSGVGTVVDITLYTEHEAYGGGFRDDGALVVYGAYSGTSDSRVYVWHQVPSADTTYSSADETYLFSAFPNIAGSSDAATHSFVNPAPFGGGRYFAIDEPDSKLSTLFPNPSDPDSGMVAYQAEDYATPPMYGDVKAALLTERGAGTLVGASLSADDFTGYADTTAMLAAGYVDGSSAGGAISMDAAGDHMVLTYTTGVARFNKAYPTVIGETYTLQYSKGGTISSVNIGDEVANGATNSSVYGGGYDSTDEPVTFVATSNPTYVGAYRSTVGDGEFHSLKLDAATPDRSVNGNGAINKGTLNRDADGWVSGFTANDYIEQPYNPDLDVGTGDFFVGARVRRNGDKYFTIMDRKGAASVDRLFFGATGSTVSNIYFIVGPGAVLQGADSLPDECFMFAYRKSGTLYCGYDDHLDSVSVANASNLNGSELAPTLFGKRHDNQQLLDSGGKIKDVMIFAGVPSMAQIKIISDWVGDTLRGTFRDMSFDPITKLLAVLTDTHWQQFDEHGAEVSYDTHTGKTGIHLHDGVLVLTD